MGTWLRSLETAGLIRSLADSLVQSQETKETTEKAEDKVTEDADDIVIDKAGVGPTEKANDKYAAFRAAVKSSMLHDKTQEELAEFKKLEKEVFEDTLSEAGIPYIHNSLQSCRYGPQSICQTQCHSCRRRVSGNRAGISATVDSQCLHR